MSENFQLLEHIHLNSRLSTYFTCNYSEDGRIFILTEAGVYILTLKGYIENLFPRYSFAKDLIKVSSVYPCETINIDVNVFLPNLPRFELYNSIFEINSANKFQHANPIEPKPAFALWSPRGLVGKTDCVLGILTNLNNLEVYVKVTDENEINEFICIAHVSKEICKYYQNLWPETNNLSRDEKLFELRRRATIVVPTAFSWSHIVIDNNQKLFCVLFVGHQNGLITAWKFNERVVNDRNNSSLKCVGKCQTELKTVLYLNWYQTKITGGSLTIGDLDGTVSVVYVDDLTVKEVHFSEETQFSSEICLKIDKIFVINCRNITFVLVVKNNILCIYGRDNEGTFCNEKIYKCSTQIVGLEHYEDNIIYILNWSGQLKSLTLSLVDNQIVCIEETVKLEIDVNKYRMHGFVFSPNRVFFKLLAYPCKLKDVNRGKGFVNCFIYKNLLRDPFQILMNDPIRSLRDYWDCFETLRVECVQKKHFPWRGLDPNLNYDKLPLIKLKILRLIAKLSEKIYSIIPYIEEYNLKAYILLNYMVDIKLAEQRITKLLNLHSKGINLSLFQMRSLDILNFFLKEMVAQDILLKANLGMVFVDEMYNVMEIANKFLYPDMPECNWCSEKVTGSLCVPYHINSRCAITLMPILLIPGYKCPFCKCIVHKQLDREYFPIFCPYCDIPMEQRYFDNKISKDLENVQQEIKDLTQKAMAISPNDLFVSECCENCSREVINVDNIEDNTMEYIIFTDSEEENESSVFSRLRKVLIQKDQKGLEENDEITLMSNKRNDSSDEENDTECTL